MTTGTTETNGEAHERGTADSLNGFVIAGTYRVGQRLGSGGMGEVREAEHVRLGRPVAIKFLRTSVLSEPRSIERFRHEARRAAAVRSEYVVKVFDYGQLEDGTPYLVMERLVGEDLRTLMAREGALPVRRAVKLVSDACRGLSAVHAAGIIHRDLKPANLFVEQTVDGAERCIILDFGVAKAAATDTTRPGGLVGTIRYMAPEQLENSAAATASADLYALGAILYEALTGVPAHAGNTLEETMFDIIHRDAPSPSRIRALPAELERAVLRMLARAPGSRFARIEDAARALAPFGALDDRSPYQARPSDETLREWDFSIAVPGPARPPSRARRVVVIGAASSLGLVGGWLLHGGEPHARVAAATATCVPADSPPAAAPLSPASIPAPPPLTSAAEPSISAEPSTPAEPAPSAERTAHATPKGARPSSATTKQPPNARTAAAAAVPLPNGFDTKNPYE